MIPSTRRPADWKIRRCSECADAKLVGGTLRCMDPEVSQSHEAFLAGNDRAARSCAAERLNVVGRCGKWGLLWKPRADVPVLAVRAGLDTLDV